MFSRSVPPQQNELPSFSETLMHAIVSIRMATSNLYRCALDRNMGCDSSDVLERALRITEMVAEQFDSIAHLFVSIKNLSGDDPAVKILAELGGNLSSCACKTANAAHEDLKKSGENVDETDKREIAAMESTLRGDSDHNSHGI